MHHTLIAGIGNVLMGDDAIGPTVVAHLQARFAFGPGVKVADLGMPGLDLALHLAGVRTVVLVDAMVDQAMEAGALRVVRSAEILDGPAAPGLDPHAPGLREALLVAARHGGAPEQVCLIGVAVESCELGAGLSPAVANATGEIVERVTEELRLLGVAFEERAAPIAPALWWTR